MAGHKTVYLSDIRFINSNKKADKRALSSGVERLVRNEEAAGANPAESNQAIKRDYRRPSANGQERHGDRCVARNRTFLYFDGS